MRHPFLLLKGLALSALLALPVLLPVHSIAAAGHAPVANGKSPLYAAAVTAVPDAVSALSTSTFSVVLQSAASYRQPDLTVQLEITRPDGSVVLHESQSGLSLEPGQQQKLFWEWRIPQRAGAGGLFVNIQVTRADGTPIFRHGKAARFTVERQ